MAAEAEWIGGNSEEEDRKAGAGPASEEAQSPEGGSGLSEKLCKLP